MKKQICSLMILSAVTFALPSAAQEASKPIDLSDMRHHIFVMEGALARAVDYGARKLNQELRSIIPDVFMLAGEAQARGVYLEGYGVYFDVQVPMLRQSMMWSLRMMIDQDDSATRTAINEIRMHLQGLSDPVRKAQLEQSLRQLERQAAPVQARNAGQADVPVRAANSVLVSPRTQPAPSPSVQEPPPPPPARQSSNFDMYVKDPNRAYTEAVTKALVDAMIDYSAPIRLGSDQWLTVAARDNEGRDLLAPQDPLDEVVTMIYRIRGADLLAYRAGKIDLDEVRRRVQITQF